VATRTITFTHKVDGTATDVTGTPLLSSPDGTFGVKRNDTAAIVVADGTALVRSSAGVYSYTFTEPAAGLAYTAYIEWIYGGETYRQERQLEAAELTATAMVAKIKAALLNGDALVTMVNADGQQVQWNRQQAIAELQFWQREAAKETGARPRAMRIRLDRF
jgi:hypothetical protein